MKIKAFLETSLIDFDGKISSVIFLPYCNFRCPYCHNKQLVTESETLETISEEKIFSYLKERKNWIDAIVITGGEPTIHKDLPELCKKIKEHRFLVKLDTNGSKPGRIKELIKDNLVDYVAIDIKSALEPERYKKATSVNWVINDIKKSIELLRDFGNYEFRTTCVPRIVTKKDLLSIANYLKTAKANKCFYLQQFKQENLIDPNLTKIKPYSREEMKKFKTMMEPYFNRVGLRGVE